MYQLLTGQLPFQARNSYDLIYQIIHSEPRRPSALRPDIPVAGRHRRACDEQETRQTVTLTGQSSHTIWRRLAAAEAWTCPLSRWLMSKNSTPCAAFAFFADFSDVELWEVVRFSQWSPRFTR
jgi:hypothetical protein